MKKTEDESVTQKVLRIYFRKTILQCRYIAAQYFRTDMFWGNLYSVSLAIISKMTDNQGMIKFVQSLDHNIIPQVKNEPNLLNWFFVKRDIDLAEYLNFFINEPLRFKLDEQLMLTKKKKWQDWGNALTENLGKAYLICKLCGESILLMYLSDHTKYCFASYETRQRIEAIDKELWEFHRMLVIEIKKGKFEVLSQYQKISKRLRRPMNSTIKLTRKKTLGPNKNFMEPISLVNIIMDDFRNKSLMIDFYPHYPTSLLEMNTLANKYETLRNFSKKSQFSRSAVPGAIVEETDESEGSIPEAQESFQKLHPEVPCFFSLVEGRKSCLAAISRSSIAPALSIGLFKEPLSEDQIQTYKKSLPKLTIFSALGIVPKLKDDSTSAINSFNKFFGKASHFSKLRSKQKGICRLGDIVKKSAEFRMEDCKLKEKLKKYLLAIRDLGPEDCKVDIVRIKELINLKITLLCLFESKFEGIPLKFASSRFRQKTKSLDFGSKKESIEKENVYFGTGKQRIKVLRDNIKASAKKVIEIAMPLYRLHSKVYNPYEMVINEAEQADDIATFIVEQFDKIQPHISVSMHESSIIRSQTLINSSELSAFRIGLLSSLYNNSTGDLTDSNYNFIEEITDQLFFSEDEGTKKLSRGDNNSVDRLDSMSSYNFIKTLGKGAYGVVWLVRRRLTGDLYAMKITEFGKNVA